MAEKNKKRKILLTYIGKYKKETIIAPAFKMLEALFELFVPLVVASIIDKGIGRHDLRYAFLMCLLMFLLALIGLTCSITAQYFAARSAVGSCSMLREDLFSHIMGLDYPGLDRVGTATLMTRITSDINQVQNGINLTLRLFLRSPFIVFGAMVMAFTIDPGMTALFAGAIFLLFLVVFGVMLVTRPIYRRVQEGLDEILSATRENLSGVRVIRAFRMEKTEEERFRLNNQKLTLSQKLAGRISGLMNPLTTVIINFAIILLIYQGAIRVQNSVLSVGQVVALYNYMSQILVELVKLANLIVTISRALACYGRIVDVFSVEAEISYGDRSAEDILRLTREPVSADPGSSSFGASLSLEREEGFSEKGLPDAVEFRDVSFIYEGGGDKALTHISFRAGQGETIGIIGGTGSGKSTLAQLIPRFYEASEGRILLYGQDLTEYSRQALTDLVSFVPQKARLFAGSLRDNLTLGAPEAGDQDIEEALALAQAKEFTDKLADGLESPVAQGGKNFSGGQKQRLTIARALVRKTPVLILDDSSSALDYATDARLRKALAHLDRKPTVFIISQRTSAVMGADKILVLHDGELAGLGTHRDLLENCGIYREIYDSQSGSDREKGA